MNRIYVCHTYYHVYISIAKELTFQKKDNTKGSIALSLMSTDFKNLKSRLETSNIFSEVIELNEVHPKYFDEIFKYRIGIGNWIFKAYTRMLSWRFIAKQEEKHINISFAKYKDIYVYCDADPIGQYLNYKKIRYHAVEDGLDSRKYPTTENENARYFKLKIILAKAGIIFIQNGYSKFAIDIEVNDKNGVRGPKGKITEIPRKDLLNHLSIEEKEHIYDVFNLGSTSKSFKNCKKNLLLLTQPLCTIESRIRLYNDIIIEYCAGYNVYIKPHPIDEVDYTNNFPDCIVFERYFPIEILNFKNDISFEKIIAIYSTSLNFLDFAKEKVQLGIAFLDKYEDPSLHEHLLHG